MDGKLWDQIYHKVMTIEYPNPNESVTQLGSGYRLGEVAGQR